MVFGSCGASSGASAAAAPRTATSPSPNTALPLLRNMRAASARLDRPAGAAGEPAKVTPALLITDARVENPVEQGHDQGHHPERGGDQPHPAPQHRGVSRHEE